MRRMLLTGTVLALALAAGAEDFPVVFFPFREATIASALDTELKDYPYKIGEPFTNGAVVAELDDARYRVAYDRAKEHREFTARCAQEQRELRQKDFASEMELRRAEFDARVAEADFADAQISLNRCRYTAPFNGKIAEFLTQRYETVKPGQPLFRIIEDDRLLAVANLPMGSVRVGMRVTILPDGGKSVTGTVYEVAPQADNRTGTVRVRTLVENPNGHLSAGQTGQLTLGERPVAAKKKPSAPKTSEAVPEIELAKDGPLVLSSPGPRYATVPDAVSGKPVPATAEALPIEISAIRYQDGVIAYALKRNPSVISVASLKRVGELSAAVYDGGGTRLANFEPQQVELPGANAAVTNILPFAEAACADLTDAKRPVKLVLRVDADLRAVTLAAGDGKNGGK